MKRLLAIGLIVLVATTLAVAQPSRTTIYSQPAVPTEDVLRRLNLTLAWSRYVPMEGRRDGFATIQLAGKDILAQTRSGLVVCLNAETGVIHWRQRVGRPYLGGKGLAFNSRSVYAINATDIYSLSRATGEQRWRYRLPGGASAVPLADERHLYLSTATGRIYAYFLPSTDVPVPASAEGVEKDEEAEGPRPILRWSVLTNVSLELPPLHTRTHVFAMSPSGEMRLYEKGARDIDTPVREGSFTIRGRIGHPAGQYGDIAYVGSADGHVYAMDMEVGRMAWRHTAGGAIGHQPVALEEDVYATVAGDGLVRISRVDVSKPGMKRALEAGDQVWRSRHADRFVAANPKFVYATDYSGRLLVLDRKRGTKLSLLDTRHYRFPVTNTATDRIYLAANDGLIVCLHDRAHIAPYNHRLQEELANPMRKKLLTPVTDPGGKEVRLKDLVTQFKAKYKIDFWVSEKAFKERRVENVMEKKIKMPAFTKRPLEEVLTVILGQIGATYDVIDDTIFILPRAAGGR